MALEFTVCEVRWDRYPRVSESLHGREWLKFQSSRGLAANTLDAYGRNLDAYLGFLASKGIPFDGVVRSTVGLYIRAIADLPVPKVLKGGREARTTLANATLQQHLTVCSSAAAQALRHENRRNRGLPVSQPHEANRRDMLESLSDPQAVPKRRCASERYSRANYKSPSAFHDRHATV
jgi:hypothetical protein